MRFAACIFLLAALILPSAARPDVGVLVSGDDAQPDPRKLSLDRMKVDILIDNGMARVRIQQVFASHVASIQEGEWSFALPTGAAVSDFAVWDDVTRIPGVILERRRAEDIYARLKSQAIDPGLLRQGEYGAEEARRGTTFSAKVVPIPGYGFKRIEIEYHERLSVEDLVSRFALPLRPDAYQQQTAGRFDLRMVVLSEHPLTEFRAVGDQYPLEIIEQSENRIVAELHAENLAFSEDLSVEYSIESRRDRLEVLTYRDPVPPAPHVTANRLGAPGVIPGYFLASALLSLPNAVRQSAAGDGPARTVIALFDSSLSMQWGKLDRSFRALETLLQQLRPQDQFNVIGFNEDAATLSPTPVAASTANAGRALEFVRAGQIRGGTNLPAAWRAAARQFAESAGEPYLFQLTDGGSTLEAARNDRLLGLYEGTFGGLPENRRPRTFTLAIGDDANLPLLRLITGSGGVFEHVRSTEPLDFKLAAFLRKIGRTAIEDLDLSVQSNAQLDLIYPLTPNSYRGSVARWVGRYLAPAARALFQVTGSGVSLETRHDLPANDQEHPHVAREWAKARVDALLEKIEREGEDRESIEEIIRWSKQFKFVTPYTSFLAAPRSLLRPRVIRPGDPILRVQTDPSITSVTALFPFGLVKQLRFLEAEDAWQTRFLAPKDTPDGRHEVRLLLRDDQGRVFRETKSFLIASKPPTVRAKMDKLRYRRGERIDLKVSASSTTRTLVARFYGAPPAELRWNPAVGYNTGAVTVPLDLPAGNYTLQLTAEDFAHNIGVEEVTIAVAP
ncbi:MAG: VIT and VWA domain-containing protein [Acidobacteria bacterium]|nr:VIT and VWA domain-containing protein [Acidobacteriota bacterium]MDA1233671.1 VIT and VWA domain-containing protein [Acidobacteriota bacterium]